MGSTTYLVIAGILFFAAASFFFAVSESALFALGKWRARQLTNKPNGVIVDGLLSRPSELLATIVLGNTIANSAIVALGVWPALAGYWPLFPTLVRTTGAGFCYNIGRVIAAAGTVVFGLFAHVGSGANTICDHRLALWYAGFLFIPATFVSWFFLSESDPASTEAATSQPGLIHEPVD